MTLEKGKKKHFSGAGNNQNMLVRIEVQDWRRCGRQCQIRRNGTENGGAIPAAEVTNLRRRGDCGSIVTGPGPVMFEQLGVGRKTRHDAQIWDDAFRLCNIGPIASYRA